MIRRLLTPSQKKVLREIKLFFEKKIPNHINYINVSKNLSGVEIGGPSDIFKYKIPIYANCKSLDFVNFSQTTIWEGTLTSNTKYFRGKSGKQYISEATNLSFFPDNEYDFLISSNCLEHVANPIKALKEWKRVTKNHIILILPFKDSNFDHFRDFTSFDHLLEDFINDTDENDLTHLDEILTLHDLKLDPAAGSYDQFIKRSLDNLKNRCLHHHVFDSKLVEKLCSFLNMNVIEQALTNTDLVFLISIN